MAGNCGECTACCRLMAVNEIAKARGAWCPHITENKRACTIYHQRPDSCRDWECGWLSSQHSDIPLPADMRPDRSHVVIARSPTGQVWFHVDPGYPDAWRKKGIGSLLNKLVHKKITVIVCCASKYRVIAKGRIPTHFYADDPPPMLAEKDDAQAQ